MGKYGISNPRTFVVGDQAESVEQEPNNQNDKANRVELNSVVNGQINPGEDVDCFVFAAKHGQRVLIECWAWRIDSRLDGFLWLYDASGKQLAACQDDNSRDEKNDPLIDFEIPADGDYYVKFSDFLYGGGQEHVYRLRIGTAPLIDFILPDRRSPWRDHAGDDLRPQLAGGRKNAANRSGPPPRQARAAGQRPRPIRSVAGRSVASREVIRGPAIAAQRHGAAAAVVGRGVERAFAGLEPGPEIAEQEPNNKPDEAQRICAFPRPSPGNSLRRKTSTTSSLRARKTSN